MGLNPADVTFTYGHHGYTIVYKGIPIGGAGLLNNNQKKKSNLKLFRQQAETTRRNILDNKMRSDMRLKIKNINETN